MSGLLSLAPVSGITVKHGLPRNKASRVARGIPSRASPSRDLATQLGLLSLISHRVWLFRFSFACLLCVSAVSRRPRAHTWRVAVFSCCLVPVQPPWVSKTAFPSACHVLLQQLHFAFVAMWASLIHPYLDCSGADHPCVSVFVVIFRVCFNVAASPENGPGYPAAAEPATVFNLYT